MKYLLLLLLLLLIVSCSGPLWDARARTAVATTTDLTIVLFGDDPLWPIMCAQYLSTAEGQAFLQSKEGHEWLQTEWGQEVYAIYLVYFCNT